MMPTLKTEEETLNIEISMPELIWKKLDFDAESVAIECTHAAISLGDIPDSVMGLPLEISISLSNDKQMQNLNKQYRNIDKPTNVLSFAAIDADDLSGLEGHYLLGDIVLSYETIKKEAQEQEKTFHNHFSHLVIHGTLHLLGYDHEKPADAKRMESMEIKIMNEIGLKNPY